MTSKYKIIFEHFESIKKLVYIPRRLAHPDVAYSQIIILEKNVKDLFQELENKIQLIDQNRRSGPR
jgi:hypothetical protein